MLRLIPFELNRIWRRRSFALTLLALVMIHVFLLWYTTLPDQKTPPLSAYGSMQSLLHTMNETDKASYIAELKENMDGICFVQKILTLQSFQNDMGNTLAQQELQKYPGVFETYYDSYESGSYLQFTDTLAREQSLIEEIYAEQQKVAGYGDYLRSIQENKTALSDIAIFGGPDKDSYSWRNVQKSSRDYAALGTQDIIFTPARGITGAMENAWTELLLLLSVMLFVGSLITEEKEKKLFLITRSTRHGILHSITAKLAALLLHCTLLTAVFYLISLFFYGLQTGGFPLSAPLQSLAPYGESCLPISIMEYLILSVLTKALVLFGIGGVLSFLGILCSITALPFLSGAGIMGFSALLYYVIPAGSPLAVFKYLNPLGLLKTENLYAGYLNFNLFGYPLSRTVLSLALLLLLCMGSSLGSILLFSKAQNQEVLHLRLPFSIPFRPHTGLLRHESYKLLITNHALVLLLLFAGLLCYGNLEHVYRPSVSEQYYRDIMEVLEGELNREKEALILSEKARYEEAFETIRRLDELTASGALSADSADALKARADMTLCFYPAFQRAESQYDRICREGGSFVYDTGYLYLFGVLENSLPIDFLLLSVGVILTVSGTITMEYQSGSLLLLSPTRVGRRKVFGCKFGICVTVSCLLALVPLLCRICRIRAVYPLRSPGAPLGSIAHFADSMLPLSLMPAVIFFALMQMGAALLVAVLTLLLSLWRKQLLQTIFFALLALVVPLLLYLLGFDMAKWFSLYPLYDIMGTLS